MFATDPCREQAAAFDEGADFASTITIGMQATTDTVSGLSLKESSNGFILVGDAKYKFATRSRAIKRVKHSHLRVAWSCARPSV